MEELNREGQKAARELERRLSQERLRYFVPNGAQEEYIRAVGEGRYFVVVNAAANGVGKTAVTINILGNIIWGPQNKWFDYPLFRKFPYPKRIRIGTEPQNMKETGPIDIEIKHWWPKGRYTAHKDGNPNVIRYTTDTGFLIEKLSYEQATKDWESATLGLAALDEPPPKDKYSATVSRMRRGGMILIPMTPLTSAAWVQDELVDTTPKTLAA